MIISFAMYFHAWELVSTVRLSLKITTYALQVRSCATTTRRSSITTRQAIALLCALLYAHSLSLSLHTHSHTHTHTRTRTPVRLLTHSFACTSTHRCKFFSRGKCTFGNDCFNLHARSTEDATNRIDVRDAAPRASEPFRESDSRPASSGPAASAPPSAVIDLAEGLLTRKRRESAAKAARSDDKQVSAQLYMNPFAWTYDCMHIF